MKDRRREMIPVDKIKVINSRTRDEAQFALNVQSIDAVGQIKDIRVNDKFLHKEGFYELICGEGRLIAQKRLGKTHIFAEVVPSPRSRRTWNPWSRTWRGAGPPRWTSRESSRACATR